MATPSLGRSAWQFLRPYITQYTGAVFSAAEYVPTWMKERSFVVHPGISPVSFKLSGRGGPLRPRAPSHSSSMNRDHHLVSSRALVQSHSI